MADIHIFNQNGTFIQGEFVSIKAARDWLNDNTGGRDISVGDTLAIVDFYSCKVSFVKAELTVTINEVQ